MVRKRAMAILLALILCIGSLPEQVLADSNERVQMGNYIQFGSYDGAELKWRAVADHTGEEDYAGQALSILFVTEDVISMKAFDSSGDPAAGERTSTMRQMMGSNDWEHSTMRQWLNSADQQVSWSGSPPSSTYVMRNPYDAEPGFLAGFSTDEIQALVPVSQKAILASIDKEDAVMGTELHQNISTAEGAVANYDLAYAKAVQDRVFLMDVKQLSEIYTNRDILGDFYMSDENYWLRTPLTSTDMSVRMLREDSAVLSTMASTGNCGIRPAMYLDLDHMMIKSGDGTRDNPYILEYQEDHLAPPVASVPGGIYDASLVVTLSAQEGAAIHYTLDGTEPNTGSPVYTVPIEISETTTLKAVAVKEGQISGVMTEEYVITLTVPPAIPAASPAGGIYSGAQTVTLTSDPDAVIYYTVDGSEPTASSTEYTGPIRVAQTTTLKAIAARDGLLSGVMTETYQISVTGGGIDEDGYTIIMTAEELDAVRDNPSGNYRLYADINLDGYISKTCTAANGWYPIGYGTTFSGAFDGNGHTVTGLWSGKGWGISYKGLFSVISGGTVTNLNIELADAGITGGYEVGGLTGVAKNGATIYNCTVAGGSVTVTGGGYAGGLVGFAYGSPAVSIVNCSVVETEVETSGNYSGGLVGALKGSSIVGSSSSAAVTAGTSYAGGLAGAVYGASDIRESCASGDVQAKYYAGGLVGTIYEKSSVTRSYAAGSVFADNYIAGGLVGESVNSTIDNCYAQGDVSGTTGVGGLVGYFSGSGTSSSNSVTDSYSSGRVSGTGTTEYGAFNGRSGVTYQGTNYYNQDTAGVSSGYGTAGSPKGDGGSFPQGASTLDMQKQETYSGWDFSQIWQIREKGAYPCFIWQN